MAACNGKSHHVDDDPSSTVLHADMSEDENALSGPIFTPPVYQQRYNLVRDLIRRLQPRKVIDMGCAQCKLLRLLKFEDCIDELIGVDVDVNALQQNKRHLEPLLTDYIFRRPRPFRVQLMNGSISDPDSALRDADLFICIEVIEHLEEPILEGVPLSVFGTMRPNVAVFSTPNSDFNVLFPRFTGFRHPDHKFEWTRNEFATWCSRICDQYGYSVDISGVGDPPANRTDLGHCSQVATFTKLPAERPDHYNQYRNNYETVFDCMYPFETNVISDEEKLCREAEYYIRLLIRSRQQGMGEEEGDQTLERGGASADNEGRRGIPDTIRLNSDPASVEFINLEELLRFHPVRRLASDVDDIKHALSAYSNYEIRLHQNVTYVVVLSDEEEEELLDEDEDRESDAAGEEWRNGSEPEDWDHDDT